MKTCRQTEGVIQRTLKRGGGEEGNQYEEKPEFIVSRKRGGISVEMVRAGCPKKNVDGARRCRVTCRVIGREEKEMLLSRRQKTEAGEEIRKSKRTQGW